MQPLLAGCKFRGLTSPFKAFVLCDLSLTH